VVPSSKSSTNKATWLNECRESGAGFAKALEVGFRCVDGGGGNFVDHGIITTPVLHFLVVCANNPGDFEEPTPNCYYTRLSTAFHKIMTMVRKAK